jgi:hypothetical protein
VKLVSRPDPDDFDKQLKTGPLQHKGFNDRLQNNIEQAIHRKEKSQNRRKPFWMLGGGIALLAFILLFPWNILHTPVAVSSQEAAPVSAEPQSMISSPPPVNTALLIGLRTEHESSEPTRQISNSHYSTYRTMLIAPVKGVLQKTSEGSGILMPYKQDFWKIDSAVHQTPTEEIHYLLPYLATQPVQPLKFREQSDVPLQRTETLIFAGNEYLSIVETEQVLRNQTRSQTEKAWVRTLPQLKAQQTVHLSSKSGKTGYISLTDLYGTGITGVLDDLAGKRQMIGMPSEINGRNWLIARTPGRWVAKAAETFSMPGNSAESYIAHDFPRALPEKVSNHDTLCCAWTEFQSLWPKAKDALTSPLDDLIVVFEADSMKFYPYGQMSNATPLLSIPLEPGEQLVMAQWATDHYVQEWIDKIAKLLR